MNLLSLQLHRIIKRWPIDEQMLQLEAWVEINKRIIDCNVVDLLPIESIRGLAGEHNWLWHISGQTELSVSMEPYSITSLIPNLKTLIYLM